MNVKIGNAFAKLEQAWKDNLENPTSWRDIKELSDAPLKSDVVETDVREEIHRLEKFIDEENDHSMPDDILFETTDFYAEIARIARRWKREGRI